ncbi:hypothetical protein PIB30_023728 [Stylosanthes scabra]|uniref:Uncharacterized protein n=1 Tax=Stylosanthes scabra TaxID=79078 RepID=A0ABU6V928_9FABA|nr:hypothetical protein [Stylosanthes scabra]
MGLDGGFELASTNPNLSFFPIVSYLIPIPHQSPVHHNNTHSLPPLHGSIISNRQHPLFFALYRAVATTTLHRHSSFLSSSCSAVTIDPLLLTVRYLATGPSRSVALSLAVSLVLFVEARRFPLLLFCSTLLQGFSSDLSLLLRSSSMLALERSSLAPGLALSLHL